MISFELEPLRMQPAHPLGVSFIGEATHPRLEERAIKPEIDLRHARGGREALFVFFVVAAQQADIVEGSRLKMHQRVAANKVRVTVVGTLGCHYGLVEPRRQYVDEVDVARELIMLLHCNGAGDEDAEMTNRLVDGVDDGCHWPGYPRRSRRDRESNPALAGVA